MVEEILEQFGQNVRAARLALNWTQEELAGAAGLSVPQISRVERGTREVRLSTVVRLIAALGVQPNDLFVNLSMNADPRGHR